MIDNNDFVYCTLCYKDVLSEEYDDELGMCLKCLKRLQVRFNKADDKKPLGKIKRLI